MESLPLNASRNISVNNTSGVLLNNTRNVYDVANTENSEYVLHSDGCLILHDSMDVLFSGGNSNFLYSTTSIGLQSSNVKFSISCKSSTDSEFIFNCNNVHNCFMCFGLRDKSYCLVNTQYSEEEYFLLVDEIKTKMLKDGEYGDGLGMEFSAQAYNFSLGQISFPLSDAEIIKLGGYVASEPETNAGDIKLLSAEDIPQTIDEVSDDIINYGIICEVTGKPFRITVSELEFYRRIKFPLPTTHPMVRMQAAFQIVPICKKYLVACAKCGKPIQSIFNPKYNFILYCERCYQAEVY